MKKVELVCVMSLGLAPGGCGTAGTDGDTGSDTESSGEAESDSGDGDGDPGDGDPGDGDPGDGDPGDGDGDDHKFDTLNSDAPLDCGDGNDAAEFSLVWVSNAEQGTISKIDSKTVTEIGRYIARPDSAGSPSRTSVSSSGHVAIANRNGGVTKIYADTQLCEESNGMPGIQTSSDDQALPWGTEECIAWHKPMAYISQRPVAWARGELDESTCEWQNEELWTSGTNGQIIDVYVLDGADGTTKEMVSIEGVDPQYFGIYGAAVDSNGDFWGSQLATGKLIRVNRADMTYDVWDAPPPGWYGMTVDAEGIVWLCSAGVGRFDPDLETFEIANVGGATGCMAEAQDGGLLWIANGAGVIGVNRDTLQVDKQWNVPAGSYGVSIDFEGYIWAISFGNTASKIDPETGQIWTYQGLVGAYTYSDMTGYALANVGP